MIIMIVVTTIVYTYEYHIMYYDDAHSLAPDCYYVWLYLSEGPIGLLLSLLSLSYYRIIICIYRIMYYDDAHSLTNIHMSLSLSLYIYIYILYICIIRILILILILLLILILRRRTLADCEFGARRREDNIYRTVRNGGLAHGRGRPTTKPVMNIINSEIPFDIKHSFW